MPVIALWTSLTFTSGTPISWDIWRTASRSARRCTICRLCATSAWVIRVCDCARGTLTEVLKPLICSPAMPITAWPGTSWHMSSASVRARSTLSITAWMSETAPACMSVSDCRTLPTPMTMPRSSSRLTTSAFTTSVPMSMAV